MVDPPEGFTVSKAKGPRGGSSWWVLDFDQRDPFEAELAGCLYPARYLACWVASLIDERRRKDQRRLEHLKWTFCRGPKPKDVF